MVQWTSKSLENRKLFARIPHQQPRYTVYRATDQWRPPTGRINP
jgi:hypothetical protein